MQLVDGPDAVDNVTVRDEDKVIWLSQTTLSVDETMETVQRLRQRFPKLQDPPSDDICYATQNRQVAVKAMAPECQLVIVVGSRNSSNSVRLVEVAGGYQFRTAKANADWVKKFLGGRPARIGRATLETLAIIAYRQPITRAEIEAIRGVDVDGVINTLLDRSLIRAVARKDVPGRPFLYGTTPEFLQLFNLKDLTHLPTLKEMEEITLPAIPGEELPLESVEEC